MASKKEVVTDFEHVQTPVHTAFSEEVHLFMHVHLRGYDKEGNGKQMHADYYDKYGAPMKLEESWLEGWDLIYRKNVFIYLWIFLLWKRIKTRRV